MKRSQDEAFMCSRVYFYRGNEKQTRTNLKNINVVLLRMSHSRYRMRLVYRTEYWTSFFLEGGWLRGAYSKFQALERALIRSGALIWSWALKILTHWDRGDSHITWTGMRERQLELNPKRNQFGHGSGFLWQGRLHQFQRSMTVFVFYIKVFLYALRMRLVEIILSCPKRYLYW